ncbi:MAG: DUF2897 family protein [Psychromonas sp.]|nr:DUF2897 family protein [Alteromonadales bacterium]MCP5079035.1 DUF2897 family protein [Psychromonas sp.]
MSGWMIFFIIALVLGIIVSNLLLLKQSAKTKIPDHILKSIAEKREQEKQVTESKKPTDK